MNGKLILIILLVVFAFLSLVYTITYKNYKIEKFTEQKKENNKENLIKNGSFKNGKNIKNFSHIKGNNEIIVYPNSGNSSYVLRQSSNNNLDETYYCIDLNLKSNTIYSLSCLLYDVNQNNNLVHKIKFNNNSSFYLKNKKDENNLFGLFNKYETYFKTPSENKQINTKLYISYKTGNNDQYIVYIFYYIIY